MTLTGKGGTRRKERLSDLPTAPPLVFAERFYFMDHNASEGLMLKTKFLGGGQSRHPFTNEDTEAQRLQPLTQGSIDMNCCG